MDVSDGRCVRSRLHRGAGESTSGSHRVVREAGEWRQRRRSQSLCAEAAAGLAQPPQAGTGPASKNSYGLEACYSVASREAEAKASEGSESHEGTVKDTLGSHGSGSWRRS